MKYTSDRILTGFLLSIGFTLTILSISVPKGVATFEDDMKKSIVQTRENTRTMERITDFMTECTSKVKSGDTSLISTCDSEIQKRNIEMAKFLAENQAAIEELIYPYSIPTNTQALVGLNSSTVTGSDDIATAVEHSDIATSYLELSSKISEECISRAKLSDISAVNSCNTITDSLNSHLREYNQNTKTEFERVLGTAIS